MKRKMIRLNLLTLISFVSINLYAQDIVRFKNPENQKWGLKVKETNKIIAPGVFSKIEDFNDSLIIVNDPEKGMAVYNFHGELIINYDNRTLFTFINLKIGNCPYDTLVHRKLFDIPMFDPRKNGNMRAYEINLNRECIPNDYFPCPYWVKTKMNENTPEYLKLLQKAEKFRWELKMDSAIYCCKKAIDLAPNNPSTYFWGANLFVLDYIQIPRPKVEESIKNYSDWIKFCLSKAEELENRPWYILRILRMKRDYIKNYLKDKESVKLVNQQIDKIKDICK